MKEKTVAFQTLGCKLNFAETGTITRDFIAKGYKVVDFSEHADVYVVHSCTVTAVAEKKCRSAISQASRRNPEAQVAVIGCYAQLRSAEIEKLKGVSVILDNQEKYRLAEIIENLNSNNSLYQPCHHAEATDKSPEMHFHPSWSGNDRTRSFLKIQDGCNHFCSYCAIPFARGRSRSAGIADVIGSLSGIFSSGIKEVVITGVNIGDFGKPAGESFHELLTAIEKQRFDGRIRISSVEPELLSDEVIALVARSSVFLPHFHLPLQSGHDDILKAMHRKYDTALFRQKVETIRRQMPLAFIAADVIVGFPGESDAHFEEIQSFIGSLPISTLHVFSYSERPATAAARLTNKVAAPLKQSRSKVLHQLAEQKLEEFYRLNSGQTEQVLFESANQHGYMEGFTRNYLRVKTKFDTRLINTIQTVKLENRHPDGAYVLQTD